MMRTDLMSSIMDLWRSSVSSVLQLAALLSLQSAISDFSSASLPTSDMSPLGSNSYSSSPSSSSVGLRSCSPLTGRNHSVKSNSEKFDIPVIRVQNQYRVYDKELNYVYLLWCKIASCWEEAKLLFRMSSPKSSLPFRAETLLL